MSIWFWDLEDFSVSEMMAAIAQHLLEAPVIITQEWQSTDVSRSELHNTPELQHVTLSYPIPERQHDLADAIEPNLPWAEDHFQERVSGEPLNPGEQYKNWPWYRGNVPQHQTLGDRFSHTYMERYWPTFAMTGETAPNGRQIFVPHMGIRFQYGDLEDVVALLARVPMTRQAYLPVWFPEDTGVVHGERVPCSLGYHFMIRNGKLDIVYYIRSCDFVRHFRDDIYLTARLAQWVRAQIMLIHPPHHPFEELEMGKMVMHISSLHCFEGDRAKLRGEI